MIVPQIYQSFTVLNYSNLMSIRSILKTGKLKYEVLIFSIRSNIVIGSRKVFYVDTEVALPTTNLAVIAS